MKRIFFFAAVAALSMISSCQKEESPVQKEATPIVFSARIDNPADTKVSVSMTDGKVTWEQGDTIVISNGSVSKKYTADKAGTSTTFTVATGTEAFTEAAQYSATYGTMPAAGVDQAYNSTPGKLVYMEAPETEATSTPNFTFSVKCGLLKLNLTASDKSIKRIYVTDGTNTYKLLCETAQPISDGEDFYIALPAGTYTKYIIRDSDGYEAVKTATNSSGTAVAVNKISKVKFSSLSFNAPVYPESNSDGTKVAGYWWAPVNCGYNATNYKYGKLYQWGRKCGQGYSTTYDATAATVSSGPWTGTNGEENSNTFYKNGSGTKYTYDWIQSGSNYYWNSATGDNGPDKTTAVVPIKTTYDPCPTGWRVPTYAELNALTGNNGGTSIGKNGWDSTNTGYWFNGTTSPESGKGLFLPAAGSRSDYSGDVSNRGTRGYYWSSSVNDDNGRYLYLKSDRAYMGNNARAYGYSVRCVQE